MYIYIYIYIYIYKYIYIYMFVCFGSVTAFVPWGELPREDLWRSPLPPRSLSSCYLSPRISSLHPASGPYPRLSSCPLHI